MDTGKIIRAVVRTLASAVVGGAVLLALARLIEASEGANEEKAASEGKGEGSSETDHI